MSVELALILLILGLVTYSTFALYIASKKRSNRQKREEQISYTLLEVRVSRHNENHFKDIEELYQSIATLYSKLKFADELAGKSQPRTSFEIIANKGSIRFFIHAQKGSIANAITHFLKGRFKTVEILEHEKPPLQLDRYAYTEAKQLTLQQPDMLPLKSYRDYDDSGEGKFTDPLSSFVTSTSTLQPGEVVWMQLITEPMNQKWIKEGEKTLELINKKAFSWARKKQKTLIAWSISMPLWLKILALPFKLIAFVVNISTGGASANKAAPNEELEHLLKQKKAKPMLSVRGRILYGTASKATHRATLLTEVGHSFATFGLPGTNNVAITSIKLSNQKLLELFSMRTPSGDDMKLNTAELALFWHPPTSRLSSPFINFTESSLETDEQEETAETRIDQTPDNAKNIASGLSERPIEEQPMLIKNATCLGVVDNFSKKSPFIIHDDDRRRHLYIIGQTGTGKSVFQEQLIMSTIYKGQGCAVIDPHGELVEHILKYIPSFRKNDVAYFDPSDTDNPPAFNVLNVDEKGRELLATELIGIFHRMFEFSWGPRMEQILFNTLMALVYVPGATLLDIPAFITTKMYREDCLKHCKDKNVIYYWHDQWDALDPRVQKESSVAVLNKVEKFLNNNIVRGVFGAKRNRFNFDFIMNKQKILLVNLSKGKLSPQNSELIGSIITSRLLVDAMKRVEIPEEDRKDFFLYIDEFQNFVSSVKTFESILSEARKYRLNLNIAHQYVAQMPLELRAAIFGNVGTVISHRIGLEDAPVLVKQFGEKDVSEEMLTTLPPYTFYSRSVRNNKITGVTKVKHLRPMAERFPALTTDEVGGIIDFSKKQYCWNEEDRKAYSDKEKLVEDAKRRQRQFERMLAEKKKKKGMAPQVMGNKPSGPIQPGTKPEHIPTHSSATQTTEKTSSNDKQVSGTKKPSYQNSAKKPYKPKHHAFITPADSGVITPKKVYKPKR